MTKSEALARNKHIIEVVSGETRPFGKLKGGE